MAVTTGKVRASYVHIFTPRVPDNGGEAKYSVTLLIPKSDTATLNTLYADIERAKQEGAQKAFNGNVPPQCKIPIYDGDGYRPSGEAFGEECKGCMVMTASAKDKPVIVGLDMQEILNPADVYSGCYIRASVNMFAYNSNGNKGIGCGLNAVQKIEDGIPLTVRVSAEEAFGGANAYSGAMMPQSMYGVPGQPAAAPPAYQAPGYPQQPAYTVPPLGAPASYGAPQGVPGQPGYPAPLTGAGPQSMYNVPGQPVPAQPVPAQPGYNAPPAYNAQMPQGTYIDPGQQTDPITGKPIISGGIMGI